MEDWAEIERAVAAGEVDVLLVSPERLNNPDFRDNVLPSLSASCGLLVVDEAHCISDWGHDFRPDYRRIRTFLEGLRAGVPVLATTATANERVVTDVADQLGEGALVLRGSLDRESLRLGVVRLESPAHRLGWLAAHLKDLSGSGIIYTLTVAAADEVADWLRKQGYEVASYSGRTDTAEREAAEADLLANRVKALVATSALGMGFDKPDLGFVVHLGAPASPIAYYQQIGRAGRATDRADVLLLPGSEDESIWRYFASLAFPPADQVEQTLKVLADAERPLSTPALEARVDLRRARLDMMLKVLDVDGAVARVRGGWMSTGRRWEYDHERHTRIAASRAAEQQAMRTYVQGVDCRLDYLRRQLDDPHSTPCGRCDSCVGVWFEAAVPAEALEAARIHLGKPGVTVDPRRMWPTGAKSLGVELSGKIKAEEQATEGRALGRLSDLGWGSRLRSLLHPTSPDIAVPDDVFAAVIKILAAWGWERRPDTVVAISSRTRPQLVSSLAHRLAEVGRLTHGGELDRTGGGPPGAGTASNAAHRLAAVYEAFTLPPTDLAGATVLLVDDVVNTGWTMTVAARELRRAGAAEVLPLALAVDG